MSDYHPSAYVYVPWRRVFPSTTLRTTQMLVESANPRVCLSSLVAVGCLCGAVCLMVALITTYEAYGLIARLPQSNHHATLQPSQSQSVTTIGVLSIVL